MIDITIFDSNCDKYDHFILDIKYEKVDLYKEFCNIFNKTKEIDSFIKQFHEFSKDYRVNELLDNYVVYIVVILDEDHFLYTAKTKDRLIECKKYFSKIKEGNCVDDFIRRGLESNLCTIDWFMNDIRTRKEIRENSNEYHQTACYEYDFAQLIKISRTLTKMLRLCDKQIEQMSDKYTKLN